MSQIGYARSRNMFNTNIRPKCDLSFMKLSVLNASVLNTRDYIIHISEMVSAQPSIARWSHQMSVGEIKGKGTREGQRLGIHHGGITCI